MINHLQINNKKLKKKGLQFLAQVTKMLKLFTFFFVICMKIFFVCGFSVTKEYQRSIKDDYNMLSTGHRSWFTFSLYA